jgi:arsenate reductase
MGKIIIYGISNCDTVKTTLAWFKKNNVTVEFHDYKTAGISKEKLATWIGKAGLDVILNKRSTTWRLLPTTMQKKITSSEAAIKIMIENTSIIKRPVVEHNSRLLVGFDEHLFNKEFIS